MPTRKTQIHLYLPSEIVAELDKLHPGYGAKSKLMVELISSYVEAHREKMQGMQTRNSREDSHEHALGTGTPGEASEDSGVARGER